MRKRTLTSFLKVLALCLLLTSVLNAQTIVVYDQAGITMKYKITKVSDFKCTSNKRPLGYYYITVYLENNSGKDVMINWAYVYLEGDGFNPNFDSDCEQELPMSRHTGTSVASTSALGWWPSGSSKSEESLKSWFYIDKEVPHITDWSIATPIFRDTTKKKSKKDFFAFLSTDINRANKMYTITSQPIFHFGQFSDSFEAEINEFIKKIKISSIANDVYEYLKENNNIFPEIEVHFSAPYSRDLLITKEDCYNAIREFINDIKSTIAGLPGEEKKRFLQIN